MTLAPEIREYLEKANSVPAPAVWEGSLWEHRKSRVARVAIAGTPEPIFKVEHRFIPGPTADLPIRIYRPHGEGLLPAMIYIHGGGWVFNTLDMFDQNLHALANKGQMIVIAVAYQKAPDHPFPIPFDDCYATTAWVFENADHLGINPKQIGICGDSAGGNLAGAVALKARDTGDFTLAYQALLYPCMDDSMQYDSAVENAAGYGLTSKAMEWFWSQYLQKPEDRQNPYAVPIKAESLAGLPPAIVVTAEYDPLMDDGYNYAEALRSAGVPVVYREYAGMIHGFLLLGTITPEVDVALGNIADEINAILMEAASN